MFGKQILLSYKEGELNILGADPSTPCLSFKFSRRGVLLEMRARVARGMLGQESPEIPRVEENRKDRMLSSGAKLRVMG